MFDSKSMIKFGFLTLIYQKKKKQTNNFPISETAGGFIKFKKYVKNYGYIYSLTTTVFFFDNLLSKYIKR